MKRYCRGTARRRCHGNCDFLFAVGGVHGSLTDDFGAIKNISRDDLLAALRIPPQLMGIVPQNAGGFGSIAEATEIWIYNELLPIQNRMLQINEWIGEEVVRFRFAEKPA